MTLGLLAVLGVVSITLFGSHAARVQAAHKPVLAH